MAKQYFWLKLQENFFREDDIIWLLNEKNGSDIVIFYQKLLCLSLRTEGVLIRNIGNMIIPYDDKSLAQITNMKLKKVKDSMSILLKIGLIEKLENGELFLPKLANMVGKETNKAEIMRKKRAKQKEEQESRNAYKTRENGNLNGCESGNNVTRALPNCYTEKEIEIEKELELEKELEVFFSQLRSFYPEDRIDYKESVEIIRKRIGDIQKLGSNAPYKDLENAIWKYYDSLNDKKYTRTLSKLLSINFENLLLPKIREQIALQKFADE